MFTDDEEPLPPILGGVTGFPPTPTNPVFPETIFNPPEASDWFMFTPWVPNVGELIYCPFELTSPVDGFTDICGADDPGRFDC